MPNRPLWFGCSRAIAFTFLRWRFYVGYSPGSRPRPNCVLRPSVTPPQLPRFPMPPHPRRSVLVSAVWQERECHRVPSPLDDNSRRPRRCSSVSLELGVTRQSLSSARPAPLTRWPVLVSASYPPRKFDVTVLFKSSQTPDR